MDILMLSVVAQFVPYQMGSPVVTARKRPVAIAVRRMRFAVVLLVLRSAKEAGGRLLPQRGGDALKGGKVCASALLPQAQGCGECSVRRRSGGQGRAIVERCVPSRRESSRGFVRVVLCSRRTSGFYHPALCCIAHTHNRTRPAGATDHVNHRVNSQCHECGRES